MHTVLGPGPGSAEVERARNAVEHWLTHAGEAASAARTFWERLRRQPDRYLIHEFGADEARAFWPSEMKKTLAGARLDYVGQAELLANFAAATLSKSVIGWTREAREMGYGAVAEDLVANRSFRADVFSRGAPRLSDEQLVRALSRWQVVSRADPDDGEGQRQMNPKLEQKLTMAIDSEPRPVGQVLERLDPEPRKAVQALLLAAAMGKADLLPPRAAASGAVAFNRLAQSRWQDSAALPGLICARRHRPVRLSRAQQAQVFGKEEIAQAGRDWLAQFDFVTG